MNNQLAGIRSSGIRWLAIQAREKKKTMSHHYVLVAVLNAKKGRTDLIPSTYISAAETEDEIESFKHLIPMLNQRLHPRTAHCGFVLSTPTKEIAEHAAIELQKTKRTIPMDYATFLTTLMMEATSLTGQQNIKEVVIHY